MGAVGAPGAAPSGALGGGPSGANCSFPRAFGLASATASPPQARAPSPGSPAGSGTVAEGAEARTASPGDGRGEMHGPPLSDRPGLRAPGLNVWPPGLELECAGCEIARPLTGLPHVGSIFKCRLGTVLFRDEGLLDVTSGPLALAARVTGFAE